MKKVLLFALLIALTSLGVANAATDYPNRPVRFLAGNAPGSTTDILARLFAAEYQKKLNQSFVVENKTGAGGDAAMEDVVKSDPDGYSLLFCSASNMFGNKWIFPRSFDQDTQLISVIDVSGSASVLLGPPALKGKSLQEVIAMAKAAPRPWRMGTATTFEAVGYAQFSEATGVDFQLVRYPNAQQAHVEMNKGDINLVMTAILGARSIISSGQVVPLAVTSPEREKALPDVPTMRELGVDMVSEGWNGIAAPAGTPREIVDLLNRVGNEILRQPEFQARLVDISAYVLGGPPETMDKSIREGGALWGRIIEKYDLK